MTTRRRVAAILGPTASGKTDLALALRAAGLDVEIVGCDALQLFSGLKAATAKPTAAQLNAAPHHLIDCIEPTDKVDAERYRSLADEAVADIIARGAWPLIVGGTGLYFRSLVRGLAHIPKVDGAIRRSLAEQWRVEGAVAMHAQLMAVDPDYATRTPVANRQRVLRALEVQRMTGRSFSSFHRDHAAQPPRLDALTFVLDPPVEVLHDRLARRASAMVQPLLIEARRLVAAGIGPHHHATQALGYRDALAMVSEDRIDPAQLNQTLVLAHRRYAKRQRTWFRGLKDAIRITSSDPGCPEVVADVAERLANWMGR